MSAATGTDWTRILSDPDLVRHVGKLLQAYREAPPEKREEALLLAMREIKADAKMETHPAPPPVCPPAAADRADALAVLAAKRRKPLTLRHT